jgi:hypothetical protein
MTMMLRKAGTGKSACGSGWKCVCGLGIVPGHLHSEKGSTVNLVGPFLWRQGA